MVAWPPEIGGTNMKPKGEDKYVSLVVSRDIYDALLAIAKKHDRSLAGEARHALKKHLRENEAIT